MHRVFAQAAFAAVLLCGAQGFAQSVLFDFEDGTDQGFGAGFGNDASQTFPIVNIGGSLRMEVLRDGGFQEAGIEITSDPALSAVNRAAANPNVSTISYDWYVDTSLSPGNYGSYLQLGTYFNSGSGAYSQDFPAVKDVELNGTDLASGQVFSGTVTETFTEKYGAINPDHLDQTFQRIGLIVNGDGVDAKVYFDNIRIVGIPEPASLALLSMAVSALWMVVRQRR